jgi:hypothetical protein
MSREGSRVVGIDPLGRFPDAPPDAVLRAQGVQQTLTKSPAPPMPPIDEYIDEAPADSVVPIYETRWPARKPAPPARSTRLVGAISFDPGAIRPIGAWRARR